jgi:hypothetical protein
MPGSLKDMGLAGVSSGVRFTRHFGIPRSHAAGEHYWLVFEASSESMQVVLNDQPLADFAGSGVFSVDVTLHLRDRNRLDVTIDAANDRDGLIGETALEIRQAAFLEHSRVERRPDGRLRATALVAGDPTENLELYLIADRHTLAYQRVPTAGDRKLELISDLHVSPETTEARLELTQAGIVWFQANCRIS